MAKPTATLLIRDRPHYRRDAFGRALAALGYRVEHAPPRSIDERDVLVIWNRYGAGHAQARRFEAAGAAVVVAENGYLPMRGTKKTFALALNHHNGAGRWPDGDVPRLPLLDINILPWIDAPGGDVLVLPQRGIGPPGVAMPRSWPADVVRRLRAGGERRVRVRPHPGTDRTAPPLERDLTGVGCCVVWGSGAGLKALAAGVPVCCELDRWIGAGAAGRGIGPPLPVIRGDREAVLESVACAQWSLEELETAEPLARLLELKETVDVG